MTDYLNADALKATLDAEGTTYADADIAVAISAASAAIDSSTGKSFGHAIAVLASDGSNVSDGETVTIHNVTYRFKTTPAQANDVQIGDDSDATLASLVFAVNGNGNSSHYYTGTAQPTDVTAGAVNGSGDCATVTLIAGATGSAGNAYASTTTATHLSFGDITFTGGVVLDPRVTAVCTLIASRLIKRMREAPFGVAGVGLDGAVYRIASIDPDVKALLAQLSVPLIG